MYDNIFFCFRYSSITIVPSSLKLLVHQTSQHNQKKQQIRRQIQQRNRTIVINYHVTLYQLCSLFFVIYILYHLLYQYFITAACFEFTSIRSDLFFLGHFIQNIKFRRRKSDLIRHNLINMFLVAFRLLFILPCNKSNTIC